MSKLKYRNPDGTFSELPVINGKSAYEYAVDGGYTGTEEEFANILSNVDKAENIMLSSATADLLGVDNVDGSLKKIGEDLGLFVLKSSDANIKRNDAGDVIKSTIFSNSNVYHTSNLEKTLYEGTVIIPESAKYIHYGFEGAWGSSASKASYCKLYINDELFMSGGYSGTNSKTANNPNFLKDDTEINIRLTGYYTNSSYPGSSGLNIRTVGVYE